MCRYTQLGVGLRREWREERKQGEGERKEREGGNGERKRREA